MIDFTKIYEAQVPNRVGARSTAPAASSSFTTTQDGGLIHREAYTFNVPHNAVDLLDQPIDLNNPMKLVRKNAFDLAAEVKMKFERRPRTGSFGKLALGPQLNLTVNYSEPIKLYESGLAAIKLVPTDEYYEAVDKYEQALAGLGDYEQMKKAVKDRARAEYEKTHPFDADSCYPIKVHSKGSVRSHENVVNKKRSQWQKNVDSFARAEAEKVGSTRNAALTASGFSEIAVKLIMNGSFEYVDTTLYWYPTTLDLARMFDLTINIPTKYFLAVDANDDNPPVEEPEFKREMLAESYESVKNGEQAFDDVRDLRHNSKKGFVPLPISKPTRWKNMLNRFEHVKVPLLSFSRFVQSRTCGINGETWDGKTGRVLVKFMTHKPTYAPNYVILTVDGLKIIYSSPNSPLPVTAYFMTPANLADTLKYGNPMPDLISVNMIRRTFLNLVDLKNEADDMFYQKSGTRRYLP